MSWRPFNDGASLGGGGSESGIVMIDDEHAKGARITLEKRLNAAPFVVTCGVYGWLVHTRFFATEEEGRCAFKAMKPSLEALASSAADDFEMIDAINAFVDRFP
jgi:hypothetical protein